uniref:Putative secreted peptide n=1 Tax=Anopheles braziliensis TaxID=58242 RepID=A0A2M3ZS28_9DIPT
MTVLVLILMILGNTTTSTRCRCHRRSSPTDSCPRRYRADLWGQSEIQIERRLPHADRLFALPDEHIVYHGAATEHDTDADQYARHDRRCRVELRERVEDDTREEDGNGNEESSHGAHAANAGFLQVLVAPSGGGRCPDQLDGEQELNGTDQQAAQVERE